MLLGTPIALDMVSEHVGCSFLLSKNAAGYSAMKSFLLLVEDCSM
jgi:hypothetical protein